MPDHASPGITEPTIQLPTPGDYTVDTASSHLTIRTRHLFGLAAVTASAAVTDGRITVDRNPTGSTVEATVAADTFASGSAARDELVASPAYLHTAAHPRISFRSSAFEPTGDGWTVRGEVTARGVSAPVDLLITSVEEEASGVLVGATATIDRYAHGLVKGKGLAARHLHLTLTIRARRA